ncbi:MAG: hypothetical protein MR710_07720 [Bacteroidales bacterium]|nr:hypothetical protein [Bacteroidales bacterium]
MINQLCKEIEAALNQKIKTPKDFIFLRETIYSRLHVLVSRTTLMRIWGYLSEDVTPRVGTLSILAQFLGYRNWEDYCRNAVAPKEQQSNPVLNRRLSVTSALDPGDCIRLTWQPDRVCDVEYLGNLMFRVIASQNTRLHEGDTFQCSLIIEGEPLYIDNLIQDNALAIAYVCGKKSGVRYELLLSQTSQE